MKVVSFPERIKQIQFCLICHSDLWLTLKARSHIIFPLQLCQWKLSPCQLLVTTSTGRLPSLPIYLLSCTANTYLFLSKWILLAELFIRLPWQFLTETGQSNRSPSKSEEKLMSFKGRSCRLEQEIPSAGYIIKLLFHKIHLVPSYCIKVWKELFRMKLTLTIRD